VAGHGIRKETQTRGSNHAKFSAGCVIARAEVDLIRTIKLDKNDCERSTHRELKLVPDFKKYRIGPRMKETSASVGDTRARPTVPQTNCSNAEAYDQDGKKGDKAKEGFV